MLKERLNSSLVKLKSRKIIITRFDTNQCVVLREGAVPHSPLLPVCHLVSCFFLKTLSMDLNIWLDIFFHVCNSIITFIT